MRYLNNYCYYTWLVMLTVAPAWRSFLTTLEWPLEEAIISAVVPSCKEVEGGIGGQVTYIEYMYCDYRQQL